ncbi:uncharacterized protein LOC103658539 isoform X11 [Ursus maritimus]|uniref:Uncharacterized protein LOC103658539 isoform X11 n=1 Tax=Ursus maritimus TaxID=29073 RepID=A0A8M1FFH8_URSMA|nr:uncharacterized protein LOC103658539 isoform X11 [Ursus maritimus]
MLGAAGRRAQSSPPLPSGALRGLCAWLDGLPLSRPKRHLARDFSDGVMLAEIVKHFYPRLVDLHNYVPTCNTDQKLSNWSVLNRKVFHKLRLWVSETEIQKVVANTPGAIEPILLALREKVKDGAVQQAPPPTADPGPSSADANSPQAQLTTPAHTGLQGPTVPSGVKTLPSQRTPERTGHCWVFAFQSGPSRWVPGAPGFRAATVTGGKGAGPGRAAGDGQDFADESGQAGAPAEAKGAADWRADKNRDKSQ